MFEKFETLKLYITKNKNTKQKQKHKHNKIST